MAGAAPLFMAHLVGLRKVVRHTNDCCSFSEDEGKEKYGKAKAGTGVVRRPLRRSIATAKRAPGERKMEVMR